MSVLLLTSDRDDAPVERALASVESQVLDGVVEVVVVDGSGRGRTPAVTAAWSERVGVAVRVLPGEPGPGAVLDRYRGLAACRAPLVAVLEDGDEWVSAAVLQLRAELLEGRPDVAVAATRTVVQGGAPGSPEPVPPVDDPGPVVVRAEHLVAGGWLPTSSCAMYRADLLERLHPEVFETPDQDWLVNVAMTEYGHVVLLPEVGTLRRAGHDGASSGGTAGRDDALTPEHLHLLGPTVVRALGRHPGSAGAEDADDPAGAPAAGQDDPPVHGSTPAPQGRVVVLDDHFPTKGTGFRIAEFDWMLRHGVVDEVMTTARPLDRLVRDHALRHPDTYQQISAYDPRRFAQYDCASLMFLNNAATFLVDLERDGLPFVLTLYPGGGLNLGQPVVERKLRRVLASPQLRHVITTQPLVTDLVTTMSGGSVPVTEVLGVTVDPGYLRPGPGLRRDYFGSGKEVLDLCFVAFRYTPDGSDKGFPLFLEVLRRLREAGLPVRGHVVGGFGPADVGAEHADLELRFAGVLSTPELREFYLGMDVIVSPTAAGRLAPGAFDGFPTGACVEASLCGVALVATDPLDQNRLYTDRRDIHMPAADAAEVAQRVLDTVGEPDGLRRLAQAGLRTTRRAYGVDAQLQSRRRILEATRAAGRDRGTPPYDRDPLVSILVPTRDGERHLRAALRSALGQSHRNIEVVVGDDASTDSTPEILTAVAASDARVRVLRHESGVGALENHRRLLEAARGEYVKFLLPDDVLATDCVRVLVRGMQSSPEVAMAFAHRVLVDEDGRRVPDHAFQQLTDRPMILDGVHLGTEMLRQCTNFVGGLSTALFARADVRPEELGLVDGGPVDVLDDVQLWLGLLAQGSPYYTPETLSRRRAHPGPSAHDPRHAGRAERDWSRLADWGARHGFLRGTTDEQRAQARALLLAADRVAQLVDTDDHGPALEAVHLATARLVELATGARVDPERGLARRAHDRPALAPFDRELDVWARVHPFALAAPELSAPEIDATVQAFREIRAAGVAERLLVAVPTAALSRASALIEQTLALGTDVDIELVPTDEAPETMLREPWLAVVRRGATWHQEHALATWTLRTGADSDAPAEPPRASGAESSSVQN